MAGTTKAVTRGMHRVRWPANDEPTMQCGRCYEYLPPRRPQRPLLASAAPRTHPRLYGLPYPVDLEGSAQNAEVRSCACGHSIVCISDAEGIRIGVASHRALPEHRAWAVRQGFYDDDPAPRSAQPTNRSIARPVDVSGNRDRGSSAAQSRESAASSEVVAR